MHIDGACQCKKITYEAEIDPQDVAICHCTDCQRLTGTAYRVTVSTQRSQFQITTGEPIMSRLPITVAGACSSSVLIADRPSIRLERMKTPKRSGSDWERLISARSLGPAPRSGAPRLWDGLRI